MKEHEKQEYLEDYQERKRKGIPFFPDAIFKDAVVAFAVFVILIGLSAFVGAELTDRADPSDSSYTPRPEWYFLFLFQLLKYFPGKLEFVGVVVLPGIAILALVALPWLDRSKKRHILGRPFVMGLTLFLIAASVVLTLVSVLEEPPPAEAAEGDPVAALYTDNCAGCHGAAIAVPAGTDLVDVISAGGHEGMPGWIGALSTSEIDALAGFILSPNGSRVFRDACAECHESTTLSDLSPLDLRNALEAGADFAPHLDVTVPELDSGETSALLNFLIAPDGHRLFVLNCASCHGNAVAFAGSQEELHRVIEQGGGHQEMPSMAGLLSVDEIDSLARFVVDPAQAPEGAQALFEQTCAVCHGDRVPSAVSVEAASAVINEGGSHNTMPVWGSILTAEQLDALTSYAYQTATGSPVVLGRSLYADNCAACHGEFGEGGPNPSNPSIAIAPISTASYLATRDDTTLRAIINQGQPDLGMSPFGLSFGGPLDEEEVGAIVAFIRAWQADPPVDLPPEIEQAPLIGSAEEVFAAFCAQCHGAAGEGGIGPAFQSPDFQEARTDEEIFTTIDLGHEATAMIAWGQILSANQINGLVEFIRTLEVSTEGDGDPGTTTTTLAAQGVSFASDVLPILEAHCVMCHGAAGGWSADSHQAVMETGDNAPVVIAGDPEGSILIRWLLGLEGGFMPPGGSLDAADLETIRTWVTEGAPDN